MLDAQPAMAPLVALARDVLLALQGVPSLDEARSSAAAAAQSFAGELTRGVQAAARRAATHIPSDGSVLTLSNSGTVLQTLLAAGSSRPLEVVCLESRPMLEGRTLAGALAAGGIEVLFAVDTALESLLPGSAAVLLGADSVGDRGIANKIGSLAAARSAAAHGVPVLVVADRSKLLPLGFPQPVADDRPSREVWGAAPVGAAAADAPSGLDAPGGEEAQPPAGVRVWNRYFEIVDPALASLVITEDQAYTPRELSDYRQGLPTPDPLRRWADSQS